MVHVQKEVVVKPIRDIPAYKSILELFALRISDYTVENAGLYLKIAIKSRASLPEDLKLKFLIFSELECKSDEFKKLGAVKKQSAAAATITIDRPIIASDLAKDTEITNWVKVDYTSFKGSQYIYIMAYDSEQIIQYDKHPRKNTFRVEVNVFREVIDSETKNLVNLLELLGYAAILSAFIAQYNKYFPEFSKFLKNTEEKNSDEPYNYPYFVTHACCLLKIMSIAFYFVQGVYNYMNPLTSSYTKHHLISFVHFIGCLLSHLSGYLFTMLLIFIAQGYTLTYITQSQAADQ